MSDQHARSAEFCTLAVAGDIQGWLLGGALHANQIGDTSERAQDACPQNVSLHELQDSTTSIAFIEEGGMLLQMHVLDMSSTV